MSVDKLLKRIFSLRLRSWLTLVALKRKKNHNENWEMKRGLKFVTRKKIKELEGRRSSEVSSGKMSKLITIVFLTEFHLKLIV